MELQAYLQILWRRKWFILLVTALVTAAAYFYTLNLTPSYVSTTTLRVITIGSDGLSGRPDYQYTELLMNTYAAIVTGGTARTELARQLNLPARPSISVNIVRNTELMRIQSEATDPAVARDVADAAAELLIRESRKQFSGDGQSMRDILNIQIEQVRAELDAAREDYDQLLQNPSSDSATLDTARQSIEIREQTFANLLRQYETARVNEAVRANSVYVVERANLPRNAAFPNQNINVGLGLLLGLFVGIGLAFLIDNLDTRLYSNDQIEAVTHARVIGEIPRAKDNKLRIAYSGNGHTAQSEAFRRLRVNVLAPHIDIDDGVKTILVTSAKAGEGKSTVAGNLGATMAQSGRQTVVIDCNIHDPSLHKLFNLSNDAGLTDILTGRVTTPGAIQTTAIPRLDIIASGANLFTPMNGTKAIMPTGLVERISQGAELLGSPTMTAILEQLREKYDIVILDSPGLMDITDAIVLAPLVDEIVLVVSRQRAQRDQLRAVQQQLTNIKAKAVGVVVN